MHRSPLPTERMRLGALQADEGKFALLRGQRGGTALMTDKKLEKVKQGPGPDDNEAVWDEQLEKAAKLKPDDGSPEEKAVRDHHA